MSTSSDQPAGRTDLAELRTILANERTLLAYIRTALALLITGASAIHLPGLYTDPALGEAAYYVIGGVLMAAAAVIPVIGYRRYKRMDRLTRGSR